MRRIPAGRRGPEGTADQAGASQAGGSAVTGLGAEAGLLALVRRLQFVGGNRMTARLLESAGGQPCTADEIASRIGDRIGRGQPLSAGTRADAEAGLGAQLPDVRLHRDAEAASLAADLGARAFTVGSDVFFGAGSADPAGRPRDPVLLHELAHTLQPETASGASGGPGLAVSEPDDRDERAATALAGRAAAGASAGAAPATSRVTTAGTAQPTVRRAIAPIEAAARMSLDTVNPDFARQLISQLGSSASLADFGPRRCLIDLMEGVAMGGQPVSRAELDARSDRYLPLLIVRPDGYWTRALTGEALQKAAGAGVAPDASGTLRAGPFEVGRFYYSDGGVIYDTGPGLGRTGPPIGEFGLEHDIVNSALDGAQDAVVAVATGIAKLITHPIQTIAGLANLPSAVYQLIANSPEYWEQFKVMPLGDQVRKVSELVTTLMLMYGTATGTASTISAAAADIGDVTVNVLRLDASGQLAVAQVSVPVGSIATAMSGGPSAVYVLSMASGSGGGGGRPPRPKGPPNYIGEIDELEAGMVDAQGNPVQFTDAHRAALERNAELVSQNTASGLRADGTVPNGTIATQLRLKRWDFLDRAPQARETLQRAIEGLPDGPIRPGDPTKRELLDLLAGRGGAP
jgi:hypothetical protein